MANQSLEYLLNEMLAICDTELRVPHGEAFEGYGQNEPNAIYFSGNVNAQAFNSLLGAAINSLPSIKDDFSRSTLRAYVTSALRKKKSIRMGFSQEDARQFVDQLKAIPTKPCKVLRQIHGVEAPKVGEKFEIGAFTVRNARDIADLSGGTSSVASLFQRDPGDTPYIECTVSARDTGRAEVLGEQLFYRLELILSFLIGTRERQFEIGILNYEGPRLRNSVVVAEDGSMDYATSWTGALQTVRLQDPFFATPTEAFTRLLRMASETRNQLEAHILRSAEWIGQAIREVNPASAFVKAAIALEVLFSANDKGLITSSIMAKIAESGACILADSPDRAIEVESKIKDLYGIRSGVVHSGKDSVDEADLNLLVDMARELVIEILSNPDYSSLQTVDALMTYLKRKRYAFLEKNPTSG